MPPQLSSVILIKSKLPSTTWSVQKDQSHAMWVFSTFALTEMVWLPWTMVMSRPANPQMCSDVIFVASVLVLVAVKISRTGARCSPVFPGSFL